MEQRAHNVDEPAVIRRFRGGDSFSWLRIAIVSQANDQSLSCLNILDLDLAFALLRAPPPRSAGEYGGEWELPPSLGRERPPHLALHMWYRDLHM